MRTQYFDVNLVPDGIGPTIHLSQYDEDAAALVFTIYNGNTLLTLTGMTATIQGTKPDNNGFSYAGTIATNTITCDVTEQMTAVAGKYPAEIRIVDGADDVGTINMTFDVETAPLNDSTVISDTEIPTIIALAREQEANAKAWAVGPSDPSSAGTDTNNAKYWAGQAASSAIL